jgi:thiol-disulfide isomerase/thioredoxin
MLSRRYLVGALALIAMLSFAAPAFAADKKPFDQKAFEAAQAAGKPVLVEVSAPWCPVCKAQAPILARLKSDAKFKELVSFDIDFDSQKDLLRKFNVQKQSTLIVFKGKQETGRSTGDTNAASIAALLGKSI